MNLLSIEKISKSYSEKTLLNQISLGIDDSDKIGLIGINGAGKSTLLKIIAGIERIDEGRIISANGISIEYLPQNPEFHDGHTVLEQVFKGNMHVMKHIREYEGAMERLRNNPKNEETEKELRSLTQKMDNTGAWSIEAEAKNILTRLGVSDFSSDVGKLSGGQRKRIAMAGALITPSDLLILDEPTNHIDNDTVDWLEKYLNRRKGALLMITHDRYFLDRVVNRIIELDQGSLFNYQGNYSKYLELKAEREEMEMASERKRHSLLRRELEWMMRGAQARSTKQKARIERFERLQEQKGPAAEGNVEILAGASRLGKKTIEIENISKSFSNEFVIKDFSYNFLRDDRIGIIGPNGSGKSTLLKIISGRLKQDTGKVEIGETVKIGLFSQESEDMDETLRVIEYIREEAEFITTEDGVLSASQMLERFLFPPAVQWTPISKLSGGEKRRLFLLKILMGAPNFLLLDEPTNDLDIKTLTILESYIDEFPGAVIAVSHDRYFLDRIVERIFSFEGGGFIRKYGGSYSDYIKNVDIPQSSEEKKKTAKEKPPSNYREENKLTRSLKFTYREQLEYDQIDDVIAGIEEGIKDIESRISEASSDFVRLQELMSEKEELEDKLENAIERWTYLNELAEEIEKNKKN